MSELPNQIPERPVEMPPASTERLVASQRKPPSLRQRLAFILVFVLTLFAMLAITPWLAREIAYSWNIGVERARAEIARQFLADHPLAAMEQRVALVAKAVAPSVVGIYSIRPRPPETNYGARGRSSADMLDGMGSGVIMDTQGYILTNYHVIANAHLIWVRLSDGREVEAEVIGRDRGVDLAVLRIDMDDIKAVSWGDSRQVVVGEQVVAIGSPYNLQQTVTSGIISATERNNAALLTRGTRRGRSSQEYLQTDAAINPGNSGGALVDMNGTLIGICTANYSTENGGNSGIGFAIPSFVAQRVYEEIVSLGDVQHGWLGADLGHVISFQAKQMNQKKPTGAVVSYVRNRSPAMEAGLQNGDIILRWGEIEISNPLHLSHVVLLSKPGTQETVEIFREGEFLHLDITVGVRPTDL